MSKQLEGRVAVVTGAARGIGRAIGIKLAQCGAFVALVDLNEPSESAALAGNSALAFAGDVSSEATWAKLTEAVEGAFGRLDIVVNNAAVFPRGVVEELDYDDVLECFGLRFTTSEQPPNAWKLVRREDATPAQQRNLDAWLRPSR